MMMRLNDERKAFFATLVSSAKCWSDVVRRFTEVTAFNHL